MLFEIEEVTLRRGASFVLRVDRLSFGAGDRIAVVGPNGAGKSTLLHLLAFLEKPSSRARFVFRGKPATGTRRNRQSIGLLKQSPRLFRGSVRRNLAYPLKVRGTEAAERASRISETLSLLDLGAHGDTRVDKLSGGERRRVALGRVLIARPQLLLLDEPTAHLDCASADLVERVISEWRTGLVLATHDLHLAHRVATRVITLEEGGMT